MAATVFEGAFNMRSERRPGRPSRVFHASGCVPSARRTQPGTGQVAARSDRVAEAGFSPDSLKPDSLNLEKVNSMSKCSCFVEKKSYSAILSLCNIPSMQHYVLLILQHSRFARKTSAKVFARLKMRESLFRAFFAFFKMR